LRGAVKDARAFEKYLRDPRAKKGLEVPKSNIVILENEAATRANIVSAIKSHFLDNPNIPNHGKATMILFYAGHGNRIATADNIISTDGKVEAIAPVDEGTTDAHGNYVYAIPDYVLGWLLKEISEKKGTNMTLIFDACFSGGIGRDVGAARNGDSVSRPVPVELDDYLWKGKNQTDTVMSYSTWSPSATSHVLLAACRQDETAREFRYDDNSLIHGRFTKQLITWLRRVPLENTTYAELLNHLPVWPGQTPQCGGSKRDRLVFNRNYPRIRRRGLALTPHTSDAGIPGLFRVNIGTAEGVVPETEFSIHAGDNSALCTLVAHSVRNEHAILGTKHKQPVTIPEGSHAVVLDWKNNAMVLHVHLPPDFPYMSDLFPTTDVTHLPKGYRYVQAQSLETADILVRAKGQEIIIKSLTSTMIECQCETGFSLNGNTAHLPMVIDGIAHFNYFLERHNRSDLFEDVALEMHRLMGWYPGRIPDRTVGNMVVNNEVHFSVQADARYGFTIQNLSPEDLFPYLFFFDPDEYTIKASNIFVHSTAPLKRNSVLTIGMGSEPAFVFPEKLPPGVSSSVGFLKLFVSTRPVDLMWIQQKTPFYPKFQGPGRLLVGREVLRFEPTWRALKVVLTLTA
ncbi:hypothetical protein DFH08DRAFT_712504, partial [Mycena albidolilacea]